ncbi:MAG: hypothetical protein KKG92_13255 [Gammaproteobacteria bacterium]|nr:hypothetical protein [Gammaproteobacteria bacterium]
MKKHAFLGAAGWDRPEWSDAFYPSDMPEEWRLTYYNTQFDCVFLAASAWRQSDAAIYESWAGDTHEHFLFLLEDARPEELPAVLAGRARGIARDDPRLLWFDRRTSLKVLAARLAPPDSEAPLYLISQDGEMGQIERVRTLLELMGL